MKLYATVTSERASKGQGGNDYITIELQDEQKKIFARLLVQKTIDGGNIIAYWHDEKTDMDTRFIAETSMTALVRSKTKGEKKKGEWCYQQHTHGKCGGVTGEHIHD